MSYNSALHICLSSHLYSSTPPSSPSLLSNPEIILSETTQKTIAATTQGRLTEGFLPLLTRYIQRPPPTQPTIIRSKNSGIPKTLLYLGKKWYLLLTKTRKQGDTLLGRGYFKQVKLAVDLSTGERHALGIIRRTSKMQKDVAQNEIDQHRTVSEGCSHIVRLHAAFTSSSLNKTYLILDECNRGDLFSLVANGPLDFSLAFRLALDCSIGLEHLHKNNILHRDLKIDNIFLYTSDTGEIRAKIGDLGLSCSFSNEKERREAKGTISVLSPERAQAIETKDSKKIQGTTTAKDDIWALGLIFFALFSKGPQFAYPDKLYYQEAPETKLKGITKITNQQIQNGIDTHLKNNTPDEIKKLLSSMLSLDPSKRPSAKEIVQELDKIIPLIRTSFPSPPREL